MEPNDFVPKKQKKVLKFDYGIGKFIKVRPIQKQIAMVDLYDTEPISDKILERLNKENAKKHAFYAFHKPIPLPKSNGNLFDIKSYYHLLPNKGATRQSADILSLITGPYLSLELFEDKISGVQLEALNSLSHIVQRFPLNTLSKID